MSTWMTRDYLLFDLNSKYALVGAEKLPVLSPEGIDLQLSEFDDQGLIFLSTAELVKNDDYKIVTSVIEIAAKKFNGSWMFSIKPEEIENVKYAYKN